MSVVLKLVAFVIDKLDPQGKALDDRDYEYFPNPMASAKAGDNDNSFFPNVERMQREI